MIQRVPVVRLNTGTFGSRGLRSISPGSGSSVIRACTDLRHPSAAEGQMRKRFAFVGKLKRQQNVEIIRCRRGRRFHVLSEFLPRRFIQCARIIDLFFDGFQKRFDDCRIIAERF